VALAGALQRASDAQKAPMVLPEAFNIAGGIPEDVERGSMSLNVRVPEELYRKAAEIAEAQHRSVDEVFAAAFAEQLAALERLRQRATRGSREEFLAVLDKVPDTGPEEYDRL
jgi:Arc-like DNA binding domain